ncbi:hypothetical protein RRF57_005119 [Xylaria bambusicola]|uniref:Uncharacterized protein n=1 Tax=Xylaria bambusicola TaxID=326684 RepID=A0AAN7UXF7_9PEZI
MASWRWSAWVAAEEEEIPRAEARAWVSSEGPLFLGVASGGLGLLLTWSPWLAAIAEDGGVEDGTGTGWGPGKRDEIMPRGYVWSRIGWQLVTAGSEEGCSPPVLTVTGRVAVEERAEGAEVPG